MLKLVILDMDGLMFDTERLVARSYVKVTKAWGLDSDMDQFIPCIGHDSRFIFGKYREYFGEDFDAPALYRAVGDMRNRLMEEEGIPVKKGLRELLEALRQRRIPMAVASGSSEQVIRANLDRAGVAAYFEGIVSSENLERGKPAPDVFLEACRIMDTAPADALVLEDSPQGIQAALAGGIPVIAVPDLVPIPQRLQQACLAVRESLDQVIALLPDGTCHKQEETDHGTAAR